ncbi:MAG: ATP-binding protein [Thermodesulfobacteriota bacterium]
MGSILLQKGGHGTELFRANPRPRKARRKNPIKKDLEIRMEDPAKNSKADQAENKIRQLNRILAAVRRVNQLILREPERSALLTGVCRTLTEIRGFSGTWIALIDKTRRLIDYAEAGMGEEFEKVFKHLKQGRLTPCCQMALADPGVFAAETPSEICNPCPYRENGSVGGILAARMAYGGDLFGVIAAAIPRGFEVDRELFREVADDLAFGLYTRKQEAARRQAQAEKQRLARRLRQSQKMEAIGTLAGGIAHDFNNILGVIIGNGELMRLEIPEDSLVRDDLDELLQAGYRARRLVAQILTFSRRSKQEKMPVRMADVIEEAVDFLRASIPATIEIREDLECDGAVVLADPTQVHQVLMNLCTNAVQAMADNGLLEILLDRADPAPEMLPVGAPSRSGSWIRLRVRDTGSGMKPAVLDRIFEPYFTTKTADEGTGLGLAVVNGIVKSHDALIAVHSRPQEGTCFSVFFPEIEAPAAPPTVRPVEPEAGGDEHILVVDDEAPVARVAQKLLVRAGYRVTIETGGPAALETFRRNGNRFDMVITDLLMPRMTGIDLAREVKRIRPEVPILLCTGHYGRITPEELAAADIADLIPKPLDTRTAYRVIRKWLDHSKE